MWVLDTVNLRQPQVYVMHNTAVQASSDSVAFLNTDKFVELQLAAQSLN